MSSRRSKTAAKRTSAAMGRRLWVEPLETRCLLAGFAEMVDDLIPGGGIRPGDKGASFEPLLNDNGTLYFKANDGVNGLELWRMNASGKAVMIEDSIPGDGINRNNYDLFGPGTPINVNGTIYFSAIDTSLNTELWRINASGQAEMIEADKGGIYPGEYNSAPRYLTDVNGTLYFNATGLDGEELWRLDTAGKPVMIEDAIPGGGIAPDADRSTPKQLTNVNGTLYFLADDGVSEELFRINASGIAEMIEAPADGSNPSRFKGLNHLTNFNGTLFFKGHDGENGEELWYVASNGQAVMVEDSVPGDGINPGDFLTSGSEPSNLTNINGTLYFQAYNTANGTELWRINNAGQAEIISTAAGPGMFPGRSSSHPNTLTNVNGKLFFRANITGGGSGDTLWALNAADQAVEVKDASGQAMKLPEDLTNVNGTLYFAAQGVLRRVDANDQAVAVNDAAPGDGIDPTAPADLTNIAGTLYFQAEDSTNGREIWRLNSSGIAEMIEDAVPGGGIAPGALGSDDDSYLTDVNGTAYFTASDGTNGDELWRVLPGDPVIKAFGSAVTYREGNLPIRVASTATVTDSDSLNFNNGRLVAQLPVNAEASDRLLISAGGHISTSTDQVLFAGTPIGTFSGGTGKAALKVIFNTQANANRVGAVLRNLTYQSLSAKPSESPRTLSVFVTDGDGGRSLAAQKTVNVREINSSPILLEGDTTPLEYVRGAMRIGIARNFIITDDNARFGGGRLLVKFESGGDAANRLELSNAFSFSGDTVNYFNGTSTIAIGTRNTNGGVGTTLRITFNNAATSGVVQMLMRSIRFRTQGATTTQQRVISFNLTDGDFGTSNTVLREVNVL